MAMVWPKKPLFISIPRRAITNIKKMPISNSVNTIYMQFTMTVTRITYNDT